ncbi:MAG: EscU/YscU/HrcU family type III secretion system export apparatus switch protein [Rhodospirillales bacterium]|nr:EscU/YscU/HrcU family type III secretion system export apparatus switch protein [Rhodospirillales bacterium]
MADSGNPNNTKDDAPQKAVALGYEPEADQRPKVLAAGHGAVAEQILQIAFANDIKVREDADLVEVLSSVNIESEIPVEALAAVAEILAYVYRANNSTNPPPDFGCASKDGAS